MPIALRMGTMFCVKHSMRNCISYSNLSSKFKAFTASLNIARVPKNIHEAMESPEWKIAARKKWESVRRIKHGISALFLRAHDNGIQMSVYCEVQIRWNLRHPRQG